jgi:hypothetical protein
LDSGIQVVETCLVEFYTIRLLSFSPSLVLSNLSIVREGVAIYVASLLLKGPIDSWIFLALVAFLEIVKAGTFFVPARLGTQDVAIVLAVALVTGDATIGLYLAAV